MKLNIVFPKCVVQCFLLKKAAVAGYEAVGINFKCKPMDAQV